MTDSQAGIKTESDAKNRSHRLFRWLIAVLVLLIVLPVGAIGFRCYYRVQIMNRLDANRSTSLILAKEVPSWIQSCLGDWSRGFDRVKVVSIGSPSPGDLRDLSFLDVEQLELRMSSLTAESAGSLSRMRALERLSINGGSASPGSGIPSHRISAEALDALARLPKLQGIWLYDVRIADEGLERLSHSESLEILSLTGRLCEAKQFRHLRSLRSLRRLEVMGNGVADMRIDADLAEIGQLSQLEKLELQYVHMSDHGFQQLKALPNLRYLVVWSLAPLTGRSLTEFESLEQLTSVTFTGMQISAQCVQALKSAKSLTYLNLQGTDLSPETLTELKAALPGCRIIF